MRTANPALNQETFRQFGRYYSNQESMTTSGTMQKTALLLLLSLVTAGWSWFQFLQGNTAFVTGAMTVGAFGGFIAAMVTVFKPNISAYSAPTYALLEGLFLGGMSVIMESQYPGIAFQAITLTFGTLATMLMLYQSGTIEVTNRLRFGIMAATGGIALVYFGAMLLSFFGVHLPFIFGNGPFGITFSLIVVAIAAFNLVMDFDFIDKGARSGAPKYMEWYGAFSLMVTLVWLYVEILRLLAKMRSKD